MRSIDKNIARLLARVCLRVLPVVLLLSQSLIATAALQALPESFYHPTEDGLHVFVMLSPAIGDPGYEEKTIEVDGKTWLIEDYFPSSGLYEIGSRKPEWAVSWFSRDSDCDISKDGRHIVRCNRYGFRNDLYGVAETWGIKMHDAGNEIASYEAADFIALPSVFLPRDSFCLYSWIDENTFYDVEIVDGFYTIHTTVGDVYRFDVSTGKIVYRWCLAETVMLAVGLIVFGMINWYLYAKYWRKA